MTPADRHGLCPHGYAAPYCIRCHQPQPRQRVPVERDDWTEPPEYFIPEPLPTKGTGT